MDQANNALGMFALGAFVGAVVTYGLYLIDTFGKFAKSMVPILSAALGVVVVVFIANSDLEGNEYAYCVGLVISLGWAYTPSAIQRIEGNSPAQMTIGGLHIGAVALMSLVAAFIFVWPVLVRTWRLLYPEAG